MLAKLPVSLTKILFVDIDGPLIPGRAFNYAAQDLLHGTYWLPDPVAMHFLDYLCNKYKVQLVLSSSWRCKGEPYMMTWFQLFGCSMHHFHKDWCTDQLGDRIAEIESWVNLHMPTTWAALDDENLPTDHLVHVGVDGLLSSHMMQLENIFAHNL